MFSKELDVEGSQGGGTFGFVPRGLTSPRRQQRQQMRKGGECAYHTPEQTAPLGGRQRDDLPQEALVASPSTAGGPVSAKRNATGLARAAMSHLAWGNTPDHGCRTRPKRPTLLGCLPARLPGPGHLDRKAHTMQPVEPLNRHDGPLAWTCGRCDSRLFGGGMFVRNKPGPGRVSRCWEIPIHSKMPLP